MHDTGTISLKLNRKKEKKKRYTSSLRKVELSKNCAGGRLLEAS